MYKWEGQVQYIHMRITRVLTLQIESKAGQDDGLDDVSRLIAILDIRKDVDI